MIEIRDLSVCFGNKIVLDHFNADLPDSGCVVIRGDSGVGKTTLLRVLAGTLRQDSGTILGMENRKRNTLRYCPCKMNCIRGRINFPAGSSSAYPLQEPLLSRTISCCWTSLSTGWTSKIGNAQPNFFVQQSYALPFCTTRTRNDY